MRNIEEYISEDKVFDGHYKLLHPLSTDGATADVWLALDTNTIDAEYDENEEIIHEKGDESGMLVAIKIYRPKNALDIEGEQRFRDEYKIVYECRHENLLQPTSFAIYKDIPYLVLPYCKYGSSEQLIGKKQTEEEIWKFISDVASGLAKLHSNQPQIIHQDIKPANILIDNSHNYAITDFGISSKTNGMHGGYYDDENSGTFAYMAPERFSDNPTPIPESDIWAFGATLCEILTGKVPFGEEGGKSQKDDAPMPSLSGMPTSIRNFIHACLQKDPRKRPTARQIVKAAQAKKYPIKRNKSLYITFGLLGCLLVGAAYFHQTRYKLKPQQKTVEEVFEIALRQMNTNDIDTLNAGLQVMDMLSNEKYIPAMYEMALTYGWYPDNSISDQRKKLLGIKNDTSDNSTTDNFIFKTRALMSDILELGDSSYAKINAEAAFWLAATYGDMRITKKNLRDYDKALSYLQQAEKWAEMADDSIITKRISKSEKNVRDLKNKLLRESDE